VTRQNHDLKAVSTFFEECEYAGETAGISRIEHIVQHHELAFLFGQHLPEADRITVTYELMGVTVEESQGKTGFFDAETTILWLAKGLQMDDRIEAIGDALQEFFGPEVLREFVCDLFRRGSVKSIEKWRRKGLILSKPTASDGQGKVEQTGEDVPEQPVPPSKSSASQAQAQSEGFSKKEGQTERDAGIRLADTTGPGGSVDHTNAAAKPSTRQGASQIRGRGAKHCPRDHRGTGWNPVIAITSPTKDGVFS